MTVITPCWIYFAQKTALDKCRRFASKCVGTNSEEYRRRGQSNANKIEGDITTGKMAEVAVHEYLSKCLGTEISEVDFNIYEKRDKSYSPDLSTAKRNYHVKCQTIEASKRYGLSWIFSTNDPVVESPKRKDVAVFCIAANEKMYYIVGMVLCTSLKDRYREPVLDRLKESKCVIYHSDIKKILKDKL